MEGDADAVLRLAPPRAEDIPALLAVERAAYPLPWSERMLTEEVLHPLGFSRAAWVGAAPVGDLAGYLMARKIFEDLHITNLAVRPDLRRRGYARRILSGVLADARSEGVLRVLLEVRHRNEPALGLYRAFGFEQVGRRVGYYHDTGEDALLLTLRMG